MKQTPYRTGLCSICDERYSYQDAHAVKRHAHPEPQNGPARDAWIASRLPYDQWCKNTVEGRGWNRNQPRLLRVDDLAPERDSPWLPIATAPFETAILVCDSDCYAPETVRLTGDATRPVYNHATGNYSRRVWPTHWMPMPQPPEKET